MSTEYKSIQQIIQSIIKNQKLDEVIERNDLIEKFKDVVGEQIAQQVQIKSFERGILTIEIESAAWKNEIFLLREKIVEKLNQFFGKQVVIKIVIL